METCGNGALKAAEPEFSIETFPHSAIIEGEEGTGKEAFADRIARALICKSKSAPCGLCSDCKKAEAGVHPDIIKLGAEQELKVDEVRELRRNAYIRPNEADVKAFIVYNCDKMNLNAQNAMLNILEEPPRGVFFLLVCENRALLLPTVLSRCAVYRMPPPELTDAEDDERVSGFIKALCSKSEFQFLS
ncbi:MAG: hypothetical protein Q8878_07665, partial [Bacillota bacterium]|nr:hypothetical protein [Bacillota bacterium]